MSRKERFNSNESKYICRLNICIKTEPGPNLPCLCFKGKIIMIICSFESFCVVVVKQMDFYKKEMIHKKHFHVMIQRCLKRQIIIFDKWLCSILFLTKIEPRENLQYPITALFYPIHSYFL